MASLNEMSGGGLTGLNPSEILALNSLLNDDLSTQNQTFEQLSSNFCKIFPQPIDQLRAGLGIVGFLKEETILGRPTQQLIASFFLWDPWKAEPPVQNPFLPGKVFLISLLGGTGIVRELLKRTPKQILEMNIPNLDMPDLSHLQNEVRERQNQQIRVGKETFPPIFNIQKPPTESFATPSPPIHRSDQSNAAQKLQETLLLEPDAAAFKSLIPEFFRPVPPFHVSDDEYIWLLPCQASDVETPWIEDCIIEENVKESANSAEDILKGTERKESPDKHVSDIYSSPDLSSQQPVIASEFIQPSSEDSSVNFTVATTESEAFSAVEIISKCCNDIIPTQAEHNWIISKLKSLRDDSLLQEMEFGPDKLPKLVENQPQIAIEVLNLLNVSSSDMTAYFETLIEMDLSVSVLEVFNRLTTRMDVEETILILYIHQCLAKCEQIRDNTTMQTRLVRMVCVFIASLIRNKLVNIQDLYIELQNFCINFNSIKEAQGLYATIQQLQLKMNSSPQPADNAENA